MAGDRQRGKPRPKPLHRQIRYEGEELAVWLGWRVAGARATARVHKIDDGTVRRVAARVEGDPVLYQRALDLLAKVNEGHAGQCSEMLHAARMQLAAALAKGLVHPRELIRAIEVLAPMAGIDDKPAPTGEGMAVPTWMAEPRVDAPKATP